MTETEMFDLVTDAGGSADVARAVVAALSTSLGDSDTLAAVIDAAEIALSRLEDVQDVIADQVKYLPTALEDAETAIKLLKVAVGETV